MTLGIPRATCTLGGAGIMSKNPHLLATGSHFHRPEVLRLAPAQKKNQADNVSPSCSTRKATRKPIGRKPHPIGSERRTMPREPVGFEGGPRSRKCVGAAFWFSKMFGEVTSAGEKRWAGLAADPARCRSADPLVRALGAAGAACARGPGGRSPPPRPALCRGRRCRLPSGRKRRPAAPRSGKYPRAGPGGCPRGRRLSEGAAAPSGRSAHCRPHLAPPPGHVGRRLRCDVWLPRSVTSWFLCSFAKLEAGGVARALFCTS